ncbi:YbaK/EbsC family protein [Nisaea sediminum]|uniref:YbaK/EbsC family protein n=1 Tax=Nisaea sediminum TaxID=2775867 RepID=UPI001866E865|nr:YbaK/EbsC family protein [Nisaea sediminum]
MSGKSMKRVAEAASAIGLEIEILEMPESTRTAEDAAAACGCRTVQIAKSLIFERSDTGTLVLLLIAGDRQADLKAAAGIVGGPLARADAKKVRAETGFAIGGVAPIGHLAPLPVFMDPALLEHETIWAAAGAPNAVFSVRPGKLRQATGAVLLA